MDSACESLESILYSEDITMKRLTHVLGMWGVVPLLGLALLTHPQPARAHGVTVGLGVPVPVVVAPAPVVVVRRGHYRHYRRHYYRRYYPGSYYRYPHRHWRHHRHYWHRW
jgi:hypothetical protein